MGKKGEEKRGKRFIRFDLLKSKDRPGLRSYYDGVIRFMPGQVKEVGVEIGEEKAERLVKTYPKQFRYVSKKTEKVEREEDEGCSG